MNANRTEVDSEELRAEVQRLRGELRYTRAELNACRLLFRALEAKELEREGSAARGAAA